MAKTPHIASTMVSLGLINLAQPSQTKLFVITAPQILMSYLISLESLSAYWMKEIGTFIEIVL